MALFLSTFARKLDKKGRVSVPPSYRAVLVPEVFQGVVVYPSFVNACIEACSMTRLEAISARIDALDPFSAEHDAFATAILGESVQMLFDNEGRIVLPQSLLEWAGIQEDLVFVGKGQTFEVWEPQAHALHAQQAREQALKSRSLLRAQPQGGV